jgi:hypothetical protein
MSQSTANPQFIDTGRLVRNLMFLLALAGFMGGCSGFSADMSADGELNEEYRLKKVYADCLKRSANDGTDCSKEKNDLLQEQEWNAMDGGV